MIVLGLGNVVECNRLWVFLNDEGKQDRIKSTLEKLKVIYDTAVESMLVYDRMGKELTELYGRKKAEADKKYHFISDEMVKEAYKEDKCKGFDLSVSKDSNNEECIRQFSKVFGIFDGVRYCNERYYEARRLKAQAENGLKQG